MDFCPEHSQIRNDLTEINTNVCVMRASFEDVKERFCKHIYDNEGKNGFRERIIVLENNVKHLDKRIMITGLLAGAVGGLIGKVTPELVMAIIRLVSSK